MYANFHKMPTVIRLLTMYAMFWYAKSTDSPSTDTDVRLRTTQRICEPLCEKTGFQGFLPSPTQTGLYIHRRWLEA